MSLALASCIVPFSRRIGTHCHSFCMLMILLNWLTRMVTWNCMQMMLNCILLLSVRYNVDATHSGGGKGSEVRHAPRATLQRAAFGRAKIWNYESGPILANWRLHHRQSYIYTPNILILPSFGKTTIKHQHIYIIELENANHSHYKIR